MCVYTKYTPILSSASLTVIADLKSLLPPHCNGVWVLFSFFLSSSPATLMSVVVVVVQVEHAFTYMYLVSLPLFCGALLHGLFSSFCLIRLLTTSFSIVIHCCFPCTFVSLMHHHGDQPPVDAITYCYTRTNTHQATLQAHRSERKYGKNILPKSRRQAHVGPCRCKSGGGEKGKA